MKGYTRKLSKAEQVELLARYKQGDGDAERILTTQVTALQYYFADKMGCRDSIYTTKSTHDLLMSFDPSRGNLSNWVKEWVRSGTSLIRRRKLQLAYVADPYAFSHNSDEPPCYDYAEDVRRLMWACFRRLSKRDARMTVDRYFHGMTLERIANKYGISSSLASYRTLKAIRRVRVMMNSAESNALFEW